eukprot:463360-Pelagomonas_calceolata.AAC.2
MHHTGEVLQLLAVLSPARPPIPISSFHVAYLLPALLVQCVLMPCCLAYTLLQPAVVWSGRAHAAEFTVVRMGSCSAA